ncbi:hypothetical protein RFI_31475 [Reticulomyxa filosa]|uniref:Uncharacterized protein n=1 Tax=Reticulomyxa filosa TaxID=46433 RepID=X6LX64_RETFI|nr:hypothetical protein RFI_31475 [Reticulomyxa filosa]|eukprot:ETO05921.1 hypothetical protein RFI_31475 [Reticulomyxa filosa]
MLQNMSRLKCFHQQILFFLWNFHLMVVNQYFGNKIIKMIKINIEHKKKRKISKIVLKKIVKFHGYEKNMIVNFFKEILPNQLKD